MFVDKDDSVIQENNEQAEEEIQQEVVIQENKIKKGLTFTTDTVGFVTGFIIAVTGATMIFNLALASTGMGVIMTLFAFLTLNILCILFSSKLKTDTWIPQLGGLHV